MSFVDKITRDTRAAIEEFHNSTILARINGEPGSDIAGDLLPIARTLEPMRKPEIWLLHPADYATFIGVRRTRVGRWVWRGRTYRTRALALRRAPRVTEVHDARVTMRLDGDRLTERGRMLVMEQPPPEFIFWMPSDQPWPSPSTPFVYWGMV
jgi:hypothetical protein